MKKILAIIFALVLVLAFAGCGENASGGKEESSKASSSQTEKPESKTESKQATVQMFKKGLWEVVRDGKRTGYYYFSADGKECKYRDVELKGGVPFFYEIKDNGYVFHMGSVDDNTVVKLKDVSASGTDSVVLVFSDREETVNYLKDCTIEEFTGTN